MTTPNTTQTPTTAQGDVFDSISAPAASPQSQPQTQPQGQGDAFDMAASGTDSSAPGTAPSAVPSSLHMGDGGGVALTAAKGVNAIGAGIGNAALDTLNGGASLLHLPHQTLQDRQTQLQHDNRENPTLNAVGYGGETLMEFLLGDGALKGASLSDKLLKTGSIARALEQSPRLMQALHLGADALRSGVTQGTLGTVRSGGDLKTGAEQGAGAAALTGAFGAGSVAVRAIRSALDPAAIQAPLQTALRTILGNVADHAGVSGPSSTSIRDVVADVEKQVRAQGSSVYQVMDRISGGAAQRFRTAASNLRDKLSAITGLDDDAEAELQGKLNHIDSAHKAMLDKLEAAGHPRDLLDRADALWTKQRALGDLSASIRQSTTGLRPELATAAAKATPEAINPKVLSTKLNRLYDSGRLTQALGPGNAEHILQVVDSAYGRSQALISHSRFASMVAKAAASAGLGGLGYEGVKLAHSVLGDSH